jgi:hypothetical protein
MEIAPTLPGDSGRGRRPSVVCVIKAGMLTTIQDAGRWGFQSRGVPVAGPMDPVSHRLVNALVGNDRHAAALEITLLGPELEFDDERLVAVTGAEFELSLDGRPTPCNAPFIVSAGSRLRFGARSRGARAYLAVSGGITVPLTLGSRSTHLVSAMGGVGGRRTITRRFASCQVRRWTTSAPTRWMFSNRRPTRSATTRIAWGSGSKDRGWCTPEALTSSRMRPRWASSRCPRPGSRSC